MISWHNDRRCCNRCGGKKSLYYQASYERVHSYQIDIDWILQITGQNNKKTTLPFGNIVQLCHNWLHWLQSIILLTANQCLSHHLMDYCCTVQPVLWDQAPVPLSIFRSNSKFDENSKHSSVKYTRSITTIFCTRHDSVTVVTCAKYRCDRSNIFETRAFWIFIEFRIRSKYA